MEPWASSFYIAPVHLYDYLAIHSGGYLCTNDLHEVIAVWLKASQNKLFDWIGLPGVQFKVLWVVLSIEYYNHL